MSNKVLVDVLNATEYLFEEELGKWLVDVVGLDVVVELALRRELHDGEDVVRCVQNFVKLYDVRMIDELQDLYFSFHLPRALHTFEIMFLFLIFRLFIIFIATFTPVRSCCASALASSTLHLRVTTCTDCPAQNVMSNTNHFILLSHISVC